MSAVTSNDAPSTLHHRAVIHRDAVMDRLSLAWLAR